MSLELTRALHSGGRRCGVSSLDGNLGCCRADQHGGDHCAHPGAELTGTPGVVIVSRSSWFGASSGLCDGTQHPAGQHLESGAHGAAERERFVLDAPTEGDTP